MIEFQNPSLLWLLLLLIPLGLFLYYDRRQSHKTLVLFWDNNRTSLNQSWIRYKKMWLGKIFSLTFFVLFTVLALAQPVGEPELTVVEEKGRDVIFLLDVSRSMDAEDLYPSRLQRVVWEIQETLPQMAGDRVALILFSGSTLMTCPLTSDIAFLSMALQNVSSASVARGGTLLGDALRDTEKILESDGSSLDRDILLITDGGDHESFPVEAAESLGKKGIRLLIIGLGSETGVPIPDGEGGYIEYQGEQVKTKLDHSLLRDIAAATPGGKYLPVASGPFQLSAIYRDLISSESGEQVHQEEYIQYKEKYVLFLIPSLISLLWLMLLILRDRRYQ